MDCLWFLSSCLQAVQYKQKHKLKDAPPISSSCAQLGICYGVGIGLYFQTISWLRMLLLWLALASVSISSCQKSTHDALTLSCKQTEQAYPCNQC